MNRYYSNPTDKSNTIVTIRNTRHAGRGGGFGMRMKGFTLFTGGGGVDIAMESLGVEVVGGIEYDDKIATVARDNGFKVTTADILQCDPTDFPTMDWLHASPPCPNFSVAKRGAEETDGDIALSNKIIEFVMSNLPKIFTLENVYGYRKSKSWARIENALHSAGYWLHLAHVNFADYGVPQTRKRMIVRAKRGGFIPYLQPTHDKNGRNGLPKWIGWYEAIEDLIPNLPDSKFANWQLKRLPVEFTETFYTNLNNSSRDFTTRTVGQPVPTIIASEARRPSTIPATFITAQGSYGEHLPAYQAHEPHGTITANSNQTGIKSFVMNTSSKAGIRNPNEPSPTVVCREDKPIAFITDRLNSSATNPNRYAGQPSATVVVYSPKHQSPNGYANGRVIKMTVRALARFQTFPDWYKNPTTRIIGNAVPPVGFANVMRGMIQ